MSQAGKSLSNKISILVSDPQQTYINKTRTKKGTPEERNGCKKEENDTRRQRK
jgi:hypothetical protein